MNVPGVQVGEKEKPHKCGNTSKAHNKISQPYYKAYIGGKQDGKRNRTKNR